MSKNKKKRNWIFGIIISLVLLISFLYFSGTIQEQLTFEEGWEPYGESTTQVTGLTDVQVTDRKQTAESKYWNFRMQTPNRYGYFDELYETKGRMSISGSDLNLITSTGNGRNRLILTTKENFGDREFKADVDVDWNSNCGEEPDEPQIRIRTTQGGIYTETFGACSGSRETGQFNFNFRVSPSPISDKATIYFDGQKVDTFSVSGDYKVILEGISNSRDTREGNLKMTVTPSWREQFGCTKNPDEQYYLKVFQEGDVMDAGDFPNWNKFCLNQPVRIYTPSGSTTTQEPLLGMVEEDKSYTIPPGQIWTVEYIGDLQSGDTACETGEVYDLEDEQCIARTSITFDFPGEEEDTTVETDSVVYEREELKTHQGLEEDNKFLFKHIVNDGENTRDSFVIGNDRFVSKYEQISNDTGRFKFDYKSTSYTLSEGQSVDLSEYLSVSVREIKDDDDPPGEYNDASIIYQFNIDTSFLNTSIDEDSNEIIIQNNYKTFLGGITLTTTDQLDTTTVENIDLLLERGKTTYQVEGEPREIKVRPYIQIETPEYLYTLEASQGATTDPNFIQQAEDAYRRNPTIGLIIVSVFALIIVGFILLIINNIVNRRK